MHFNVKEIADSRTRLAYSIELHYEVAGPWSSLSTSTLLKRVVRP